MSPQTEQHLENILLDRLEKLGWKKVAIHDEDRLIVNLHKQMELHNKTKLSRTEFEQILNNLARGNLFEKAENLRDRIDFTRDDGTTGYVEPLNMAQWCKNEYQVTRQFTMLGKYTNRYDVTLLVNGLPLCQIELKRRGLEIKEAFNQTNRYHRHSFSAGKGLFGYIQLFVISNGVNTKYYANNPVKSRDFKQTFYWTDPDNKRISQLSEFADAFLEKCQFSKMVTKYIVLHKSDKLLMALRPYQYYAVEAIVDRVLNTAKHGYIWHTTGSGKTLTSFKAAQILTDSKHVRKIVFVVDRKDLDFQTIKEFNSYQDGSVDGTNNTKTLVRQFGGDTRLIVTTLQKLDIAIKQKRHLKTMRQLKDERMVFIFDECHRGQFGDMHKRIRKYFSKVQMFGFTGTPIFSQNAYKNISGKRTTRDLFDKCLHKYVITDAIRDENVLRFMIEYIRTVRRKDQIEDIEVEAIDTAEVMGAHERLEKIVDYIIANHDRKTYARDFTAIFCVSNVKTLIEYYELLSAKRKAKEHNLKVGTIFSYQDNEDDLDADGMIADDDLSNENRPESKHSREKLDEFISDYNTEFGTNFSTENFYGYYKDIGKRVRNREIDILLVVDMFLTGFDSKSLNTIYVDKNLKFHGLLQSYSRTNRIYGTQKSQGNVVCFRNLKSATDEAIALFANKDAQEEIILDPYEKYVKRFEDAVAELFSITPDINSVDDLLTEEDEFRFIRAFRELIRIKNVLDCFTEFCFDDLPIDEQVFADFRSKYLDLYQKVKNERETEKVSILTDVDFEIELIARDKINVTYIINLLRKLAGVEPAEQPNHRKAIMNILDGEAHLRSKKELIERFIAEHMPNISSGEDVEGSFENYWDEQKRQAFDELYQEEGLKRDGLERIIGLYLFTEKSPLRNEVIKIMVKRPSLQERGPVVKRVVAKIQKFVEIYIEGMG